MSRLYGKVPNDLIEEENKDEEEQSGFRTGRSCTDSIFCMKQVNEKRNVTNQEIHLLFVDLTKACDSIPISKLWKVLGESNINYILIKTLQNLYGNTAQVKIGNILAHPFNITKGLRQGCCISPTLFKIYLRKALEEWKRKCSGMCIPLESKTLCNLQFADDQVVLSGDKEDLEYMTRKLKETYEKWGLDMNLNKTKYLCIGETDSNLKLYKDSEIEFCQKYKYLGVIFDTSGTDNKEIRSRVIQARKCVACLNGKLWSEDIRKERKLNIYNALIESSLLYGSETWRHTENKRWVEATEMDAVRRSSRISRKVRIRNVTIRQQIGLEAPIVKDIEQKQLT